MIPRLLAVTTLFSAMLLSVSCRHVATSGSAVSPDGGGAALSRSDAAVRGTLRAARRLMLDGQLAEAQALVTPLLGGGVLVAEVVELSAEINRRRVARAIDAAQKEAAHQAMQEVGRKLSIPDTYGRTVTITGDNTPLRVPPGPMEAIVEKRVPEMLFPNGVDLKGIIEFFSNTEGLNIIADQALTGDPGDPEAEPATIIINARDVPLQELLSYIARNMGVAFHLGENTIWVTESTEPPGTGPKMETRIFSLRTGYIPPMPAAQGLGGGGSSGQGTAFSIGGGAGAGAADTELEDALDAFLADSPAGATYRIYRNRNLLIVRNSIEQMRLIEDLVGVMDREPLQVLIEARFVTIRQSELFELGVDIPEIALERSGTGRITTLDAASAFPVFAQAASGGNIALTGILGKYTYSAVLHALERSGTSKTLSAPRITVLNNQEAKMRRGDRLRYYEDYEITTITNEAGIEERVPAPTGNVQELELGITFSVRPSIGNDGKRIMLALVPEIIEFLGYDEFMTAKLPKTNESTLSTTVMVNSGETVVLGGNITKTATESIQKVPILGDLPLIGRLFRHTDRSDNPEHLLIFVTATLISGSGEFVDVQPPTAADGE